MKVVKSVEIVRAREFVRRIARPAVLLRFAKDLNVLERRQVPPFKRTFKVSRLFQFPDFLD